MEKQPNKVIRVIRPTINETQGARDLAEVTGQDIPSLDCYFQHMETGECFSHLAMGLGWPGPGPDYPGYVIVMAVEKTDAETPMIYCLEEAEAPGVDKIIGEALDLRKKYGFGLSERLLSGCFGDRRLEEAVNNYNRQLPHHERLSITEPKDFDGNFLELYAHRLQEGLNGQLDLRGCQILRNRLFSAPPDLTEANYKKYPAIFAAGGLYYTLTGNRPWLQDGGGAFTVDDGFE